MKRIMLFQFVLILFAGCKKSIRQEIVEKDISVANNHITANVQPATPYTWKNMTALADGDNDNSKIIQSGNNVYCVVGLGYAYKLNNNSKLWEPAPVQQFGHFETGQQFFFSYNGRIYFGMNRGPDSINHQFTSNLPDVLNSYTSLARFPGTAVSSPTCFVVGDKGYIMGGYNFYGNPVNQLWEYNFITNQWLDKGGSPLGARVGAVAMVVGDKVYMGLGYDHIYLNGTAQTRDKGDWILYYPSSTFFTVKASFPGTARTFAEGFVLNDMPFIGFGSTYNPGNGRTDFWKYSPLNNTWTEQQSWTGTASSNARNMKCFSLGNTGYAVKGSLLECKRFSNTAF